MIVERSLRAARVVIDPVRGFTAADGTYGLLHGASEKVPIRQAVEDFAAFVADLAPDIPAALIRPLSRPGQFATEGPMRDICLTNSPDVGLDPLLIPPSSAAVIDSPRWRP